MPKQETVQVFNPSPSHQLHLNSISGDSPVFHASFFRSKVSLKQQHFIIIIIIYSSHCDSCSGYSKLVIINGFFLLAAHAKLIHSSLQGGACVQCCERLSQSLSQH